MRKNSIQAEIRLGQKLILILFGLFSLLTFFIISELALRCYIRTLSYNTALLSDWIPNGFKFGILKQDYLEYDPLLVWRLKSKKTGVAANSLHTRGGEFSKTKKIGVFRIVCIGDSCTYGAFIDNNEDTYCKVLENMLNSGFNQSTHYGVINAGVPGYGSFQALTYLQKIIVSWKPDLVIIYIGHNNYAIINHYFNLEPQVKWPIVMRIDDFLESSYLYNFMKSCFLKIKIYLSKNIYKDFSRRYYKTGYDVIKAHYLRMADIARENGFKIIFLNYPTRAFGEDTLGQGCEVNQTIAKAAYEAEVPLVDIIKAFQSEVRKALLFDTVHPTIAGHKVIAQTIFKTLLAEKIIPRENYKFDDMNF